MKNTEVIIWLVRFQALSPLLLKFRLPRSKGQTYGDEFKLLFTQNDMLDFGTSAALRGTFA
ncbi:MAG TPA: hypothetical protein DCM62_03715 [Bacteroidales bacterium]|nr:hypothetical protein [Bacteroidales bacterium]